MRDAPRPPTVVSENLWFRSLLVLTVRVAWRWEIFAVVSSLP